MKTKIDYFFYLSRLLSFAGDRNIDRLYPNDPHGKEEKWPGGIGELTNVKK